MASKGYYAIKTCAGDHEWHYSDGRRVIALKELNTESGRENVFFSDQHD